VALAPDAYLIWQDVMKPILKPSVPHEAIELLALSAAEAGVAISSPQAIEIATKHLQEAAGRLCDHTIYGNRTQAMFGALVASLGQVQMVRQEDGVACYASTAGIKPPDFRVIFPSHCRDCLIEVKNCHRRFDDPFRLRVRDMRAWRRYARHARTSFKIAVYFSKYGYWALLSPSAFDRVNNRHCISFVDAMKRNEMEILGDVHVGTRSPLSIRLRMGKISSRPTVEGEKIVGRIIDAGFYCRDQRIESRAEQQIASLLMMYGDWEEKEYVKLDEPEMVTMVYEFRPEEKTGRGFEFCGLLSRMFSRWYIAATSDSERKQPTQVHARTKPIEFKRLIPKDYKGKDLPLWLFHVRPNLDR